jgi:radical SAM-linked protein
VPLDLLIRYSVHGDLAQLSHLDSLRLWQRLLRRAEMPLRFSEGYNVRPRLRILLPRPVGTTSEDERLRVGLTEDEPRLQAWSESLRAVMPEGFTLEEVQTAGPKAADRVVGVEYVADLPAGCAVDPPRADDLLAKEQYLVRRRVDARGHEKEIDIRPYVQSVTIEEARVRMRLAVTNGGSARPREILAALGVNEDALANVRLHRTQIMRSADSPDAEAAPESGSDQATEET